MGTNEQQKLIPKDPRVEELGPHMVVMRTADKPGTTTCRWAIGSKSNGAQLGTVSWYGRWRCYVFHPVPLTLFNAACLDEIKRFLERNRNTRQEVASG